MKRQKTLGKLIIIAGIILAFAGCTKEGPYPDIKPLGSDPIGTEESVKLTGKTFSIDLNECTPLIYFADNTYYGNYQAIIDITPKFRQLNDWPKAGDQLEITYNYVANEDFPAIYSSLVDISERASFWTTLSSEIDVLVYKNLKKGTTKEAKVNFIFAQAPYDNISVQVFYDKNSLNKTASIGTTTGFGNDSPADCEFMCDFKNMDEHPLKITTYLCVDGLYLEVSETKTLLPYSSARFYYDFDNLQEKYSNFYGDNVYFLRKIEHPAFDWANENREIINWNYPWDFSGWKTKPFDLINKKLTSNETFNYTYNESTGNYSHNPVDNPDSGFSNLTSEDKQQPDEPYLDTAIAFPYNAWGPNYQASIPVFTDSGLKTGDRIKLTLTGVPDDTIGTAYICIADNSPEVENYWRVLAYEQTINNVFIANKSFTYEHTFDIIADSGAIDLSKIRLVIRYESNVLNKATSMKHCNIKIEKL